jgi:hypothetical protein
MNLVSDKGHVLSLSGGLALVYDEGSAKDAVGCRPVGRGGGVMNEW